MRRLGITPFLLAAAVVAGCTRPGAPPASPGAPLASPAVEVRRVQAAFTLPAGPDGEQRLVASLRRFASGRMDALHLALPPTPAMRRLAARLALEGVLPRKTREDPALPPWRVVAARYVVDAPPCPTLDIVGAAWGGNASRPGFGCAARTDFALQAADPADLLGNDAVASSDPDRAAIPVARWRGFTAGAASGGPSATAGAGSGAGTSAGASAGSAAP